MVRSRQFGAHRIISNLPQIFNCGNPIAASPEGFFASEVILLITACSSSSISSLIFLTPSPALNKSCFSIDDGVLQETESAIQINVGVQALPLDDFLLLAPLLAATRVWVRLLFRRGLNNAKRSSRTAVAWLEDDEALSAIFFLQASRRRIRSPIVPTPRCINC